MAEVVDQPRQLQREVRDLQVWLALLERLSEPPGEVAHAQAVLEPGVRGAGKDVMDGCELPDALKALELPRVDHAHEALLPVRVPVDRAEDDLHARAEEERFLRRRAKSDFWECAHSTVRGTCTTAMKLHRGNLIPWDASCKSTKRRPLFVHLAVELVFEIA